jgi:hypothetical protein
MVADLTQFDPWDTAIVGSAGRFFMLAVLADQPRHGYDIARRIGKLCDGGRARNVYFLTPKGEDALRVAARAWATHLHAIRSVVQLATSSDLSAIAKVGLCTPPPPRKPHPSLSWIYRPGPVCSLPDPSRSH